MEVGVDVMKLFYTGDPDSFREVVEMSPVPVVCAGGPRMPTFHDFLRMASEVVSAGARGLTVGRNVWEQPDIPAAMRALHAIVHEGKSVEEAMEHVR
jgi:class I fructose-bisphosphate aldolase